MLITGENQKYVKRLVHTVYFNCTIVSTYIHTHFTHTHSAVVVVVAGVPGWMDWVAVKGFRCGDTRLGT